MVISFFFLRDEKRIDRVDRFSLRENKSREDKSKNYIYIVYVSTHLVYVSIRIFLLQKYEHVCVQTKL